MVATFPANRPNWFVGNDGSFSSFALNSQTATQLRAENFLHFTMLALVQRLADTDNGPQPRFMAARLCGSRFHPFHPGGGKEKGKGKKKKKKQNRKKKKRRSAVTNQTTSANKSRNWPR